MDAQPGLTPSLALPATPRPAAAVTGPPPPSDPVYIAVEEKISCVLNKDGGVENCEVQGTMSLQVRAPPAGLLAGLLTEALAAAPRSRRVGGVGAGGWGGWGGVCVWGGGGWGGHRARGVMGVGLLCQAPLPRLAAGQRQPWAILRRISCRPALCRQIAAQQSRRQSPWVPVLQPCMPRRQLAGPAGSC